MDHYHSKTGQKCPVFGLLCPVFGRLCPVFGCLCPVLGLKCPVFKCHSNTGPFGNRMHFNHLKTRLVRFSDAYCIHQVCLVLRSYFITPKSDSIKSVILRNMFFNPLKLLLNFYTFLLKSLKGLKKKLHLHF